MTSQLIEQLVNGLITGASYALVGAGLALIWGTLKMINLAHGELYMLGGYSLFVCVTMFRLNPYVSLVISVAVVFLMSCLVEKTLIEKLLSKSGWDISPFVVTLGVSIFLQNLALRIWGERFKNVPYFNDNMYDLLGARVSGQRVVILLASVVVITVFMLIMKRTRVGWSVRATAQDREAATIVGVSVKSVFTWTVGLSGALAALAGATLAPIYSVNPWMGISLINKGFVVCVLGGLGSVEGAMVAGIVLGCAESLGVMWWTSEWKDVIAYSILVLVLWMRPSGLFGTKEW